MDKLGIDSFEDLFSLMAQAHLRMPQSAQDITLLPDAGPLITMAYANALDVLFKPGWRVGVVDRVLHEVTPRAPCCCLKTTPLRATVFLYRRAESPKHGATAVEKFMLMLRLQNLLNIVDRPG